MATPDRLIIHPEFAKPSQTIITPGGELPEGETGTLDETSVKCDGKGHWFIGGDPVSEEDGRAAMKRNLRGSEFTIKFKGKSTPTSNT